MSGFTEQFNQELAGVEATLNLTNGESFRIKGEIKSISDLLIIVNLSNNPDKKGRKMVNVNHIVSIDWYVS